MDKHSCTIVIDTNQFRGDFMLSETRWENLLQYLKKTNASLQMPTIIWEEIAQNFRKNLQSLLREATSTCEKINHLIEFNSAHFNYQGSQHSLNISDLQHTPEDITSRYMAFLKASLGLELKDFLDWDEKWMSDIVARAVDHIKPFSEEGDKGLKDTLIWKTILSLATKHGFKDAPIVFISANSRDFGVRGSPGKLHASLQQEAIRSGLNVHYFENLDTFFGQWAAEALSIDFAKIRTSIPEGLIKTELQPYVRRYMPKDESAVKNTFISGMSFKVISEVAQGRKTSLSISGYITNSLVPTKYLDFSAELLFEEGEKMETIKVISFDTLDPDGFLHSSLAEVIKAYKDDLCE